MKKSVKFLKGCLVKGVGAGLFVLSGLSSFGQDTIVTRSGQQIVGQIMEVTTTEVRYKKIEITDGPVYSESKSSIERIKYKNGYHDVFPETKPVKSAEVKPTNADYRNDEYRNKLTLERSGRKYLYGDKIISENQMHKMMLSLNNPEITRTIKMAKTDKALQYIGFGAIPLCLIGVIAWGISTDSYEPERTTFRNAGIGFVTAGAIVLGTSIYFKIDRKSKNAKAVGLYARLYK